MIELSGRELIKRARDINLKMNALSRKFVEITKSVGELQSMASPEEIASILAVEARLSAEDIKIMSDVSKIADRLNLPKTTTHDDTHFASPETLRIIAASSEEVQWTALRAFGSGQPIGQKDLARIESFLDWSRVGDEQTASTRRVDYLLDLHAAEAPHAIKALEQRADQFLDVLYEFLFRHQPTPEDATEIIVSDSYLAAHRKVSELASPLLTEFERLLGDAESIGAKAADNPQAKLAAQSHQALSRFASGRFGHDGGFSLDAAANDIFSTELWEATCYLGSQSPEDHNPQIHLSKPGNRLRVLELGAGAGGMAIGLMSAGFAHQALYENNNKRVNTLRSNWRSWPVIKADIRKLQDVELEQYKGIDLLAGGIPSAPVGRSKKKPKKESSADLVPHMLRAVEITQPRAFMFEMPPSFAYEQHLQYLIETSVKLEQHGYQVHRHDMDTRDYGLPQQRTRIVLVGIRIGENGRFIPPKPEGLEERSVVDVIGPLFTRYVAEPDPTLTEDMQKAQLMYNTWVKYWSETHRGSFLPTIPVSCSEFPEERLDPFLARGFDSSSYADAIPQVEDFVDYRGRHGTPLDKYFKPRLTLEMIAAAQGFPPPWTFHAIGGGNVDMVAEALPPIMSKAVGIQIYSALTGATFDLDAALAGPMIDEGMIGKDSILRRRIPKWRTAEFLDRAEDLIRLDQTLRVSGVKNAQKRQEQAEQLLKELLPSKRGNGAKKVALERNRLRTYVERELAARDAEDDAFFQ